MLGRRRGKAGSATDPTLDPEKVRDAVKALLDTEGVFGVTAEAIASRLGSSPARVQAEVDIQSEIVEGYRDLGVEELAEVRRTVLANPSPVQQMRALLSWLATPPEQSDALRLEVWALSRRNPQLREVVRMHEASWHGVVASVVRRGARNGEFPQSDAEEIAAHLISLVDGVNNYELIGYRADTDRLALLKRVVESELGLAWGPALQSALQ